VKLGRAAWLILAGTVCVSVPTHARARTATEAAEAPEASDADTDTDTDADADTADAGEAPAASPNQSTPDDAESTDTSEDDEAAEPVNPFLNSPPESVENSLQRTLKSPAATFCNKYQNGEQPDPQLCEWSRLPSHQRCPALARACAPPPPAKSNFWNHIGDVFGGAAEIAYWGILALMVVLLAMAVRRMLGAAVLASDDPEPRELPLPDAPKGAPRVPNDADVARLWARAQQSALATHFDEAVAALQGALIHALRVLGNLHVSPAYTNGDYLRALRSEPSLHGAARDVFRAVEGVQFGGSAATPDLYQRLFERVRPIVERALTLGVVLLLCWSQSGCSAASGEESESSARGLGVLTQLLTDQQTTVRRRIRALKEIEPQVTEILVAGELPDEAWSKLLHWVSDGGTLIVTDSAPAIEKKLHASYMPHAYRGRLELGPGFDPVHLELSANTDHALDFPTGSAGNDRLFARVEGHPYIASRQYGEGSVLFFADGEFLSNASLSIGDNAFFAVSLLTRPRQVLEIVGPWTGGGATSIFGALRSAGLGPLLLQLLVLTFFYAWCRGTAFGTRRDPVLVQRRAFRDHVLALGDCYRKARATRFVLATYGAWLTERLRERLSPQQPIGLIDLAGRIAARYPEPETALVLLLTETREAQDDLETARPSPADLQNCQTLETLAMRVGGSK